MVILQQLDQTDRKILLALDEDPRIPVMLLAQKLGLAIVLYLGYRRFFQAKAQAPVEASG